MRLSSLVALLLFAYSGASSARVFSYKESGFAAYIRGTAGLSAVGSEAVENSSGTDTSLTGDTLYNYGGEFGFMLGLTPNVHLRLGAEIIQHKPISDGSGKDQSGTERFTYESSVFIFNPNATLEYAYSTKGNLRFYSGVGLGLADITVENRYTMTAAGTSDLGVTSFDEKLAAQTTSGHFLVGLETTFVDNANLTVEVGYRYLPVRSFKYKGATNNIVSPTGVNKGDVAYNQDGNKRTMDLGGLFFGAGFRFYLNFL